MTDIVDGLRENYPNMTDAFEAAREITRLRAELAAERERHETVCKLASAELDDMQAQLDALRELLGEAADVLDAYAPVFGKAMIARIDAALKGDGG